MKQSAKPAYFTAQNGQKITYWLGADGKYYTKKKYALNMNQDHVVDVSALKKASALKRYQKWILSALAGVAALAAVYYFGPVLVNKVLK